MAHRLLGGLAARWMSLAALVACCAVALPPFSQAAFGQAAAGKDEKKEEKKEDKKKEIPPPEDITLDTADGVQLKCTYFASLLEKQAVPVILVHGWGGSRKDFDRLALGLQAAGHAVIAPDLRGHGGSTLRKVAGVNAAQPVNIKNFKASDMQAFATLDLEAVKQYLITENNSGKLNIEQLCVVGSEFGAICAVNWAVQDWSWPQLPNMKQGQDVKALVLISPEAQFKGYKVANLPQYSSVASLSMLLIAGKKDNHPAAAEVRRMEKNLERFHYKYVIEMKDDEKIRAEKNKKRDLFTYLPETSLQGKDLLTADSLRTLRIQDAISAFLQMRLVNRADEFRWASR